MTVSEEGLPNGVPDTLPAGLDRTNSTTASGTITATDADTGDVLTMTLGTPTTPLTSGGVAITWMHQNSDHTLIGKAGDTTIITTTITDAGAYNVTLNGPIDHPVANQEDIKTFTVPVTVTAPQVYFSYAPCYSTYYAQSSYRIGRDLQVGTFVCLEAAPPSAVTVTVEPTVRRDVKP